jgi:hypothetical protein
MTAPKFKETHVNPDLPDHMEQNRVFRRARITKPRWNPKEWHPIYEEVVLLDCMGLKRSEIASRMGFTEMHITNILKTEQAQIVRKLVIARINGKAQQTIEQRLETVTLKAMQRVEDVINNDVLAEKNPLGLFDRAITLLKGTRKIQPEDGGTHINRALIVSEQQFDKLIKGTALADEAKRLNPAPGEIVIGEDDDVPAP